MTELPKELRVYTGGPVSGPCPLNLLVFSERISITVAMKQSPSWEADSSSDSHGFLPSLYRPVFATESYSEPHEANPLPHVLLLWDNLILF
jgi:hypothetical protein